MTGALSLCRCLARRRLSLKFSSGAGIAGSWCTCSKRRSRARLDDESAWRAANPGIAAGIKSARYMADEARRVAITTSDQASFPSARLKSAFGRLRRSFLLASMIFSIAKRTSFRQRDGPCFVGVDLGSSASMCGGGLPTGLKRSGLNRGPRSRTRLLSPKGARPMASAISTNAPGAGRVDDVSGANHSGG